MRKVEILVVNSIDKKVPESEVEKALNEHKDANVFELTIPVVGENLDLLGVHIVVREVAES